MYIYNSQFEKETKKRKANEDDSFGKSPRKSQKLDNNHTDTNENESNNDNFDDPNNVTSSLFTGNPDIPRIPQKEINQVVEKVFSENAFGSLDISYQIVSFYYLS